MPKALYFDCFSGASGDMILGALLDAGLPLGQLKAGWTRCTWVCRSRPLKC
jgi:uncharacterized protein (DUF111 family)